MSETTRTDTLVTTVLWQSADRIGLDRCQLRALGGFTHRAHRLTGTTLALADGRPTRIRYRVDLDRGWRTTDVDVRASIEPGRDRPVLLRRRGRWKRFDPATDDWERVREIDGLTDIDLAFTPATNLIPIRRLRLAVGESAETTAAWLTLPDLTLQPLHQTYTRTADRTYAYRSPNLETTITVDEHGLPIDYAGLWTRVATYP